MLDIADLHVRFGGLTALAGLDMEVRAGEVCGVIGPNGSGKTTFFNAVTGVSPPAAGSIRFDGRDITGRKPYEIARLGIARTFQNLRVYPRMTVFENVWVAQHSLDGTSTRELVVADRGREAARREEVDRLLEATGLAARRDMLAKNLPLPDQRRLELARALARAPRLLLLDEPAGGMTPRETEEMASLIRDVAAPGRTCLVIEHKMDLIAELCDRIVVLSFGKKIADGPPRTILNDPAVLEVYLGQEEGADA